MIFKCELPPVAVSKMPNKFMSTKKKSKKAFMIEMCTIRSFIVFLFMSNN